MADRSAMDAIGPAAPPPQIAGATGVGASPAMKETTTMRLQELKRRVDEADYRVDVDAVASAILRRPDARRLLLAGHPLRLERATPRRGAH